MAVTTVPLQIDMRGGTQIENVTKFVQDALGACESCRRDRDDLR